jgi:hypothetical protein
MPTAGAASKNDFSLPLKNLRRDTRQASKWTPPEPASRHPRERRGTCIHFPQQRVELVVAPSALAFCLLTCFRRKCLLGET